MSPRTGAGAGGGWSKAQSSAPLAAKAGSKATAQRSWQQADGDGDDDQNSNSGSDSSVGKADGKMKTTKTYDTKVSARREVGSDSDEDANDAIEDEEVMMDDLVEVFEKCLLDSGGSEFKGRTRFDPESEGAETAMADIT